MQNAPLTPGIRDALLSGMTPKNPKKSDVKVPTPKKLNLVKSSSAFEETAQKKSEPAEGGRKTIETALKKD